MVKKKQNIRRKTNPNKRGEINFLGEHTLGIIIAVICIIILLFIGYKVYGLFSEKTDLEKAESNFKLIKGEMEIIKSSPAVNATGNIIVYSTKGWVLRSYFNEFPETECYGKKFCLCLCQDGTCYGVSKVCEGFDYEIIINSDYIDSGYVTSVVYPHSIGFLKPTEGLKINSWDNKIFIEQTQNA